MKKDKLPEAKQKHDRPKFVPCGRIVNGGAYFQNGAECVDGYWYFWAMHYDEQGNEVSMERFGKPCRCLLAWKGKPVVGVRADHKALAAGA